MTRAADHRQCRCHACRSRPRSTRQHALVAPYRASEAEIDSEAEIRRTSKPYIKWVQHSLNRILGLQLAVDGISGPMTRSAVRTFQQERGLAVDGIVGPQTEAALVAAGADPPPGSDLPSTQPASPGADYPVIAGKEYGPKWGARRPPGLPASARHASAPGAAHSAIERTARAYNLGEAFVRVVTHLAQTESGATYALPAEKFDARPAAARAPGESLTTAWGAFQFNRDAWRALPGVASTAYPWHASAREEIERPVARYAALFREVRTAGGDDLAAARGIRLWHRSPVAYRSYLRAGQRSGFAAAWRAVASRHRALIDSRMKKIGLLDGSAREVRDVATAAALEQETSLIPLSGSVGSGGVNKMYDVLAIQFLLNKFIIPGMLPGIAPLVADGQSGPKTIAAIKAFQRVFVGMRNPDGRVDPGGATLQRLHGSLTPPSHTGGSVPGSSTSLLLPLVNTRLPKSGPGFTTSGSRHQYGVPETIEALQAIAKAWHQRYPNVRFMIRDISQQGGGQFGPHASHRIGLDADVQLWIDQQKVCMSHPKYAQWRPYVQELVSVIRSNPVLQVKTVGFTDPQVRNVSHWPGHTCHLHIRFCMPPKYKAQLNLNRVYRADEKKPSYSC